MSKEAMKLARAALARMKGYGDTFGYRSNTQNPYEQVCEAIAAIDALAESRRINAELLEALSGIDVYLTDTLSGRVNPDPATYKQWLVDGIIEVRNRARAAITRATGEQA